MSTEITGKCDEWMAMGFPVDEITRQTLREMVGQKLPTILPGSIQKTCEICEMLVWLGPMQVEMMKTRPEFTTVCIICVVKLKEENKVEVQCLNNPDSKYED